jgi:hypothetical protein
MEQVAGNAENNFFVRLMEERQAKYEKAVAELIERLQ